MYYLFAPLCYLNSLTNCNTNSNSFQSLLQFLTMLVKWGLSLNNLSKYHTVNNTTIICFMVSIYWIINKLYYLCTEYMLNNKHDTTFFCSWWLNICLLYLWYVLLNFKQDPFAFRKMFQTWQKFSVTNAGKILCEFLPSGQQPCVRVSAVVL